MGTEAQRRVYGIGGSRPNTQRTRYFVTIPMPWLRSIEKTHGKQLKTLAFAGYTDRAILTPMWGEIIARSGSTAYVSVWSFSRSRAVMLPLSWLRTIGFNPSVHGRRKPTPTPFKILVETTDDNKMILKKMEVEAVDIQQEQEEDA